MIKLASALVSTTLISVLMGCAHHGEATNTVLNQIGATSEPFPTDAPQTPSPSATICPEDGFTINDLPKRESQDAEVAAPIASKSSVRIELYPGTDRSSCSVVSGTIIAKSQNTYSIVTVGHAASGVSEPWITMWPHGPRLHGKILAFDTAPDIAILTVKCIGCKDHIRSAVPIVNIVEASPLQIVGTTDASIVPLTHNGTLSNMPIKFADLGETNAWFSTKVAHTGIVGDGVWSTDGKLVGMAFFEGNADTQGVIRVAFVPVATLRGITSEVLSNNGK